MLLVSSAIATPVCNILPYGNFGEDYGISARSSMEKWQAVAKS
jgi:translation initiation factor IF-3